MKVFITGGAGFIGSRIVQKLVARGDEVVALARSLKSQAALERMGATVAWGDVTDKESMRPGMQGADIVFHVAGWYKIGARHQSDAYKVNVEGTRNVLELAQELGVPRVIYTSTVAVLGNTRDYQGRADENYVMPVGLPFVTEYDRTKWMAHYQVAVPMIEKGAPVIIVMPGAVYGPGDTSLIDGMMDAYLRGLFFLYPGADTVLCYSHVDDIAEGHLLAAEKGRLGESYLLAGPGYTTGEMARIWARLSGKPAPIANVPGRLFKPLAPVGRLLSKVLPMPEILSEDAVNILGNWYLAYSNKAVRELGWANRPIEEGMAETLAAKQEQISQHPLLDQTQKRAVKVVLLASLAGVVTVALLRRRRRRK